MTLALQSASEDACAPVSKRGRPRTVATFSVITKVCLVKSNSFLNFGGLKNYVE